MRSGAAITETEPVTEPGDLLRATRLVADEGRPGRYLGAIPDAPVYRKVLQGRSL